MVFVIWAVIIVAIIIYWSNPSTGTQDSDIISALVAWPVIIKSRTVTGITIPARFYAAGTNSQITDVSSIFVASTFVSVIRTWIITVAPRWPVPYAGACSSDVLSVRIAWSAVIVIRAVLIGILTADCKDDDHDDSDSNRDDDSRDRQSNRRVTKFSCLWRVWHRLIGRLNCTNTH